MNINNITAVFLSGDFSSYILLSSTLTLLFALVLLRRKYRKQSSSSHVSRMQNDLRALTTAAVSMGERVLEIERRQRRLAERQDQMDIYDSANQPYEQAIRMVQNGAKVEELVKICGLSTNEAQLIHMMHRFDKAS